MLHILPYGFTAVFDTFGVVFALTFVRAMDRHPPSIRLFRNIPRTVAFMFGAFLVYSLLQMAVPFMDTPRFDTLGNFVLFGSGLFVAIIFLVHAHYKEDTGGLLLLLFVLVIFLDINVAGLFPLPSPPSLVALFTDCCAIWSVGTIPGTLFDRWLRARLRPHLPLPSHLQSARSAGREWRTTTMLTISAWTTAGAIAGLSILFEEHQQESFGSLFLPTAGVLVGFYLLYTCLYWGCSFLLLSRPSFGSPYRPLLTRVTIISHPFDEQQPDQSLYQGATSFDGTIPPEVQTRIDGALQTGEAIGVSYYYDNGIHGTQTLPSYCRGEWPQCMTCTCREASSLPVQGSVQTDESI